MSNNEVKKQDYLGIIEYIDEYPYIIHHAEGRIINKGVEQFLKYVFLDHTQNVDGLFAAQRVESIGNIIDSTTHYEAAQQIVLEGGFEVDLTAEFTATIINPPTYQADWQYQFTISDHLGNLRMMYSDLNGNGMIDGKTEVTQETSYYPYGMRHSNYERTALKNNYQYNGIEHVGDFGLDLNMATYRSLDAALGQWGQVDPKSEALYHLSPYVSMGSNPISNVDPDGDLPFLAAVALGAIANGSFQAASGNINSFGDFMGSIAIGGASVAAGIGAVSTFGVGGVGFWSGAANGAIGGATGGFVGGASGAWMNGSSFGQGLKAGGIGAGIGGLSGGAIGGLASGIDAVKHGGNFWSGKGATYETLALQGTTSEVGKELEYSTEYAKEFSDKHFGDVKGLNDLYADGSAPDGYTVKGGNGFNSKGGQVNAVTRYRGPKIGSDVYLFKSAFGSTQQLYITMGHEYLHVGFFSMGMNDGAKQHVSIGKWQYEQSKLWGFRVRSAALRMKMYGTTGGYDILKNPNYIPPISIKP